MKLYFFFNTLPCFKNSKAVGIFTKCLTSHKTLTWTLPSGWLKFRQGPLPFLPPSHHHPPFTESKKPNMDYSPLPFLKAFGSAKFVNVVSSPVPLKIYSLMILCIKQVNNESLLYSNNPYNSTQYSVVTWIGKKKNPKGKIYLCTYGGFTLLYSWN